MDKLTVKPGFLSKLFGKQPQEIEITVDGIFLTNRGERELVTWDLLSDVPKCSNGWFFSSLEVGEETIRFLPKSETGKLVQQAFQHFYYFHSTTAKQALNRINEKLSKVHYIRTSHVEKISAFASSALGKTKLPDTDSYNALPSDLIALYGTLRNWSSRNPAFIDSLRNRYIEQQLAEHGTLFDKIESNPLTDKQRLACITDEDNNLVLAGAGTGKTSTMIGKTAYLIESKQAVGHEILLLAYGNKAAAEMRERIQEKLGVSNVAAYTFHVLGQKIISDVEGEKPSISPLATDEKLFTSYVDQWFSSLLSDTKYKELVLQYFEQYLFPEANPFEFETQGDYYEYIRANEIRTFKGENVKSFEECLIANWLYSMGIEYKYEVDYQEANTRTPDFRQYKPDFYLPQYQIYLEHFGIDKQGSTAPYVDKDKYWEGINWKRALHEEHETVLIETYHHEQVEGELLANLETKLALQGVKFNPLPADSMLNTLREFGAVTNFSSLLSALLKQFKSAGSCLEALKNKKESPQLVAAAELLEPIIRRYEDHLAGNREIDFEDMIHKAISYVEDGRFKSHWKFILVDEFQDISFPRAELVKKLRDSRKNTSIFCVGDDWQAIYRFTGSDVGLTTGFDQMFGATKTISLDKTFRFNNKIGDVASRFVMKNPSQVKKEMHSHLHVDQPSVSLIRKNIISDDYYGHVVSVLTRISETAKPGATVYVLARYHFKLFESSQLRHIRSMFPNLEISQLSFHASKGKEADFVIIVGLDNGKHGFPSKKLTHPLIEELLPKAEEYPEAEERRLFYVAITRAKHRCYLIADMTKASSFVKELVKDKYELTLDEFGIDKEQSEAKERRCRSCESGTLIKREGPHGTFMGCSNYPLCNYKESTCPRCNSTMNNSNEYRICSNSSCSWWIPICPECGGNLMMRESHYGKFWGCENYRSVGSSCCHRQKFIEPPE
ncbi:UvrD-helicase domain-containing protein [Neptuniibacter caesariensis]|uniref:DNA 3'-5' helicase n=1 Tax=Neptuniibacter caesariensis TaxID=207954 RepID=A0A7U8C5S5_NEPCE|nr:UvrD-helicase domain-containing protein [Neptuniibacter caesariensis]EAR62033.1 helicase IV [Oceanospirillum sp. MED92] [Neptuniibacter caesariensis]